MNEERTKNVEVIDRNKCDLCISEKRSFLLGFEGGLWFRSGAVAQGDQHRNLRVQAY